MEGLLIILCIWLYVNYCLMCATFVSEVNTFNWTGITVLFLLGWIVLPFMVLGTSAMDGLRWLKNRAKR